MPILIKFSFIGILITVSAISDWLRIILWLLQITKLHGFVFPLPLMSIFIYNSGWQHSSIRSKLLYHPEFTQIIHISKQSCWKRNPLYIICNTTIHPIFHTAISINPITYQHSHQPETIQSSSSYWNRNSRDTKTSQQDTHTIYQSPHPHYIYILYGCFLFCNARTLEDTTNTRPFLHV